MTADDSREFVFRVLSFTKKEDTIRYLPFYCRIFEKLNPTRVRGSQKALAFASTFLNNLFIQSRATCQNTGHWADVGIRPYKQNYNETRACI